MEIKFLNKFQYAKFVSLTVNIWVILQLFIVIFSLEAYFDHMEANIWLFCENIFCQKSRVSIRGPQRDSYNSGKMSTTPCIPRRSPIQVLT